MRQSNKTEPSFRIYILYTGDSTLEGGLAGALLLTCMNKQSEIQFETWILPSDY